jgi:hypothetical protein
MAVSKKGKGGAGGRTCYSVELDPEYAAVTLERMSALGLKPELQK